MPKYTYKPHAHRVLVEQFEITTESESGIQLYSNNDEQGMYQAAHTFGKIIAMGETAFTKDRWGNEKECEYSIGDDVYFKQYPGPEHSEFIDKNGRPSGKRYYTINDIDILGHVEVTDG
jgi:co-chaperonin GroES (HSP10)